MISSGEVQVAELRLSDDLSYAFPWPPSTSYVLPLKINWALLILSCLPTLECEQDYERAADWTLVAAKG